MSNSEQNKDFSKQGLYEREPSISLDFSYSLTKALECVKQNIPVILFGPPGTGKSYIVDEIKKELESTKQLSSFDVVQFHKKFSYEDFIEGYSPSEEGNFKKKNGVFKTFCQNVTGKGGIDLFVIDEINRADLSTTLGEVLYLIEDREQRSVKTSHFSEPFSLPKSVSLIGTMNTADRSISNFDFAIRRRFRFIPVFPDYTVLKQLLLHKGWKKEELDLDVDEYVTTCQIINSRISKNPIMGRHMELGHMMFFPKSNGSLISKDDIITQFIYVILPQIEAYCGFGNENVITDICSPTIANRYLNSEIIDFDVIKSMVSSLSNSKEDE